MDLEPQIPHEDSINTHKIIHQGFLQKMFLEASLMQAAPLLKSEETCDTGSR
jgi:hypothetical protein